MVVLSSDVQTKINISVKTQTILFQVAVPINRETLIEVAQTSLRTKLHHKLADHVAECVVDAVLCIQQEGQVPDLHMVEIQEMMHESDMVGFC